jgi:hypothetical protein
MQGGTEANEFSYFTQLQKKPHVQHLLLDVKVAISGSLVQHSSELCHCCIDLLLQATEGLDTIRGSQNGAGGLKVTHCVLETIVFDGIRQTARQMKQKVESL